MNDNEQPDSDVQPLRPAERRRQAIARCTEEALSKAQHKLEDKYMNVGLRRVIDGMNIEAISIETGIKLVYAAQVALHAFRPPKHEKGKACPLHPNDGKPAPGRSFFPC